MNMNPEDWHALKVTATDLARQRYYEELLENSRRKLAILLAQGTSRAGQKVTMDILFEETVVIQAERELKRLKDQTSIHII